MGGDEVGGEFDDILTAGETAGGDVAAVEDVGEVEVLEFEGGRKGGVPGEGVVVVEVDYVG